MVIRNNKGWTVRVRLAGAQAVHLLGQFNNWSTVATPMHRETDDMWQTVLPAMPEPDDLRLFVWRPGDVTGHLHREDEAIA